MMSNSAAGQPLRRLPQALTRRVDDLAADLAQPLDAQSVAPEQDGARPALEGSGFGGIGSATGSAHAR